ncbi:hypothetical protein PENTCL1PPCAC_405, partial [Pristionchus entomophagus]
AEMASIHKSPGRESLVSDTASEKEPHTTVVVEAEATPKKRSCRKNILILTIVILSMTLGCMVYLTARRTQLPKMCEDMSYPHDSSEWNHWCGQHAKAERKQDLVSARLGRSVKGGQTDEGLNWNREQHALADLESGTPHRADEGTRRMFKERIVVPILGRPGSSSFPYAFVAPRPSASPSQSQSQKPMNEYN